MFKNFSPVRKWLVLIDVLMKPLLRIHYWKFPASSHYGMLEELLLLYYMTCEYVSTSISVRK